MNDLTYIERLKEKCDLDDDLITQITNLFDSLINFGYISNYKAKKLSKRLYNNISTVIVSKGSKIDYKSGYYDAIKKELYLKDVKNTEAVYLRLLYAITTVWYDRDSVSVGYGTTTAYAPDYNAIHKNYAINRAIFSNLVCRLLYTLPETLSIMPSYRNYQDNFLGYKIDSYNDIYGVEGILFRQICHTLNINEENLYFHLFSNNPVKYFKKLFNKAHIENVEELLNEFDNMSRKYSNYNKLCYLDRLLNNNYLEMKKHMLNNSLEKYQKQDKKIKLAIATALQKYSKNDSKSSDVESEIIENLESNLNEKINDFEDEIISSISKIQNILVQNLISRKDSMDPIDYAYNLKQLEKLLLVKNQNLENEVYDSIYNKILDGYHDISTNLIEKMKYSLINEILSNNKFQKARKSLSFKRIHDVVEDFNDTEYVTVEMDKAFIELVKIKNLRHNAKELENNTEIIQFNNLQQILSTNTNNEAISQKIEKVFADIKNEYEQFKNVELKDMYICGVDNFRLLIIVSNDNINVIKLENSDNDNNIKNITTLLSLSDSYKIFDNSLILPQMSQKYLPVLYKEKNNIFTKIFAFLNNNN